jgi:hypothetical protein
VTAPQTVTLPVVWEPDWSRDGHNLRVGSIDRIGRVWRRSDDVWFAVAYPTGGLPDPYPTLDAAKDAVLKALGAAG